MLSVRREGLGKHGLLLRGLGDPVSTHAARAAPRGLVNLFCQAKPTAV